MLTLRDIQPEDNTAVSEVILTVMSEFACVGEGFSSADAELEDMHAAYRGERSAFFVLLDAGGDIVGTGGFAPLAGGDASVCELRKMYLLPRARGRGEGKRLLQACIAAATARGYRRMYLETVRSMDTAARLYRSFGFTEREEALGCTGHGGCDRFMVRDL